MLLENADIVLLLSVYFLFFIAFVFLQTSLSPWLQTIFGFGSLQTGLVFFFVGGVSVFTQAVLLPQLSKKFSRLTLTILGVAVFTVGLFAMAIVGNLVLMFAVAAVIAFGFGIQFVTVNTLISLNTPQNAQGGALGITGYLLVLHRRLRLCWLRACFCLGFLWVLLGWFLLFPHLGQL